MDLESLPREGSPRPRGAFTLPKESTERHEAKYGIGTVPRGLWEEGGAGGYRAGEPPRVRHRHEAGAQRRG